MAQHTPAAGRVSVADLLRRALGRDPVDDVPVHEGATEEYADELREMRAAIAEEAKR